jgi:hypothetical protein
MNHAAGKILDLLLLIPLHLSKACELLLLQLVAAILLVVVLLVKLLLLLRRWQLTCLVGSLQNRLSSSLWEQV